MTHLNELVRKLRPVLNALEYERSGYAWMCVALGNYDEVCTSVNNVNDVVVWAAALAMCNEAKKALVVLESYVIATCAVVFASLIACDEVEQDQESKIYTLKSKSNHSECPNLQDEREHNHPFTSEYVEKLLQLRNKLMSIWYAQCYPRTSCICTPEAIVGNAVETSTSNRLETDVLSAEHESVAKIIRTASAPSNNTTITTNAQGNKINSTNTYNISVTDFNYNVEEHLTELQYLHLLLYARKDDALCREVLRLVLGVTDWVAIHRWYIVALYLYDVQSSNDLLQESEEQHVRQEDENYNSYNTQKREDKHKVTQMHSKDHTDSNRFSAGVYHAPYNMWFCYYMSLFTSSNEKLRWELPLSSSPLLSLSENIKEQTKDNKCLHKFEQKPRLSQQETLSILLSHCEEWEVEMITAILAHTQRRYRTCMLSATHALQSNECVLAIAALSSSVQIMEGKLCTVHTDSTSEAMSVLFAKLSYVVMMLYMRCISALELTERPQAGADIKTLLELGQKWLTLRTAMHSASGQTSKNASEEIVENEKNTTTTTITTTKRRRSNNSNSGNLSHLSDAYLLVAVSCAIAMFGLGLPEAEALFLPAQITPDEEDDNKEMSSCINNNNNDDDDDDDDVVVTKLNSSARRYVYTLAEYIHALTLMQLGEVSSAICVAQEAVPFASAHEIGNNLCQLIVYGATAMEDSSCILSTALSPHCLLYLALCPAFFGGLTRHGVKLKEGSDTFNLLKLRFPFLYMSSRQALPLYVCAAQRALTSHNLSSAWININKGVAIADDIVGSLEFIFSDCYPLKVFYMGILIGKLYSEHLLTEEVKAAQACLAHEETNEEQIKAKEELFARHDACITTVLHTCEHFVQQMKDFYPHAYLSDVACTLVAMMQHDKLSLSKAILLARRYPNRVMAQNLLTVSLFHNLHIPEAVDAAQKNIQDFPHTREIVTTAQMLHKKRVLYTFNYRTLLPLQYAAGKHDRIFTKRMIVVILFVCVHVIIALMTLIFNNMSVEHINHLSPTTNAIAVRLQLPSLAPLYFAVLYFVHAVMSTITSQNLVRVLLADLYFCDSRLSRFLFCMRGIALVNVCNALQISLQGNNFIAPNIFMVIFIYIVLWMLFLPFTSRVWFLPSKDEPSVEMLSWATLLCIDALMAIALFIPHLFLAAIEPLMSIVFYLYTPVPRPDRDAASSSIRRRLLYHEHHKHDMPHRFAVGSGSHFVYIRLMSLLYYETHSRMSTLHLSASQLEEECYRVFPLFEPEIVGSIDCQPLRTPEELAILFAQHDNEDDDHSEKNHLDITLSSKKTTSNESDTCLTDMLNRAKLMGNNKLINDKQLHIQEHSNKVNKKLSPDDKDDDVVEQRVSSDMVNALKREFDTQKMDNLRRIASFVKPKVLHRSFRTSFSNNCNHNKNNINKKKNRLHNCSQYSFTTDDDDDDDEDEKAGNELQNMEQSHKVANTVSDNIITKNLHTEWDAKNENSQHIEDAMTDDLSFTSSSSSSISSSASVCKSDYNNCIDNTERHYTKTMTTRSKNEKSKATKQVHEERGNTNEKTIEQNQANDAGSTNDLQLAQQREQQQYLLPQNNEEEMESFFYMGAEPWIAAETLSSQLLAELLSIPTRTTDAGNATPTNYDDIEF